MSTICYRKSDLSLVGTVADNMTVEEEINLNVISNFGGVVEDYDYIETNESYFHLENIGGIITVVTDIPVIPPQPPTIDERVSALEDAMLLNLGL